MSSKTKYSRRQITSALIDMLEADVPAKRVAQVLAAYLIESRQTRNVELYLRDIEIGIADRLGIVTAHVSSAKKLRQETLTQIKNFIVKSSDAKTVETIEKIDPNLIGGVIIETADSELDGSIRTKLQQLRSI